jgi:hypothetical protein
MARKAQRRRPQRGKRATGERWQGWQLATTIVRIVVDVLEMLTDDHWFGGGRPGRLL